MLEVLDGAPSGSGAKSSGLETMVTNLVIAESQHELLKSNSSGLRFGTLSTTATNSPMPQSSRNNRERSCCNASRTAPRGDADYHEALQEFVKAGREHICGRGSMTICL
jgi:hypothetical protein